MSCLSLAVVLESRFAWHILVRVEARSNNDRPHRSRIGNSFLSAGGLPRCADSTLTVFGQPYKGQKLRMHLTFFRSL